MRMVDVECRNESCFRFFRTYGAVAIRSKNAELEALHRRTDGRISNPNGGPTVQPLWVQAIVREFLDGEIVRRGMCLKHAMLYLGIRTNKTIYKTKYPYKLDDGTVLVDSIHNIVKHLSGVLSSHMNGIERTIAERRLAPPALVVDKKCCKKLHCLKNLSAATLMDLRQHVFSLPQPLWSFGASPFMRNLRGETQLCQVAVREIWGFSFAKIGKMNESLVNSSVIPSPLFDGRSVRTVVAQKLSDGVKLLLKQHLDNESAGASSPERAVVLLDSHGKPGMFERWLESPLSAGAPRFSYATFRRVVKLYQQENKIKFKRRARDHSICPLCLDYRNVSETYRKVLQKASLLGQVAIPIELATKTSELEAQKSDHLRKVKDRRHVAFNVRKFLMSVAPAAGTPRMIDILEADICKEDFEVRADDAIKQSVFGAHFDAKSRVDLPNLHQQPAAIALTQKCAVGMTGFSSLNSSSNMFFLLDGAHGKKNGSLTCDLILLYIRMCSRGSRRLVLVMDNANASNKNGEVALFLSLVVAAGILDAAFVVFLYPYHGKWLADNSFGQFQSAIYNSHPPRASFDSLAIAIDEMKGSNRAFIVGQQARHRWDLVFAKIGIRRTSPPSDIRFSTCAGYCVSKGSGHRPRLWYDPSFLKPVHADTSVEETRTVLDSISGPVCLEGMVEWPVAVPELSLALFIDFVNDARLKVGECVAQISDSELGLYGWGGSRVIRKIQALVREIIPRMGDERVDRTEWALRSGRSPPPPPPPEWSRERCRKAADDLRPGKERRRSEHSAARDTEAEFSSAAIHAVGEGLADEDRSQNADVAPLTLAPARTQDGVSDDALLRDTFDDELRYNEHELAVAEVLQAIARLHELIGTP